MSQRQLTRSFTRGTPPRNQLGDWLFANSPGLQISGDSGCGKSNAMEVLAGGLLRQGQPLFFIDPHGQTAKRLERLATSLPERLRRKVIVIRPADTRQLVSINPLAVPRGNDSELDWQARLTSKVGHVSRILLAAWGEADFNSRPRMFTWITRILKTLGTCGLTIPDARYFLDVGSELYIALTRAVPDLMNRHAFEDLGERKPKDIDEQIESTRTRMLGFLENPIIEAMLGRTSDVLDFANVIDEGGSVIVDLEPQGKLRDEDQTIIANLLLTEFIYTVMNLSAVRRKLYFVFVDELPVFAQASGPLLIRALCEIRKFLVRFVLAHQGTQRFPQGVADPFLNTIVGQCGVHLYFRHANPVDAKYFGEIVALPDYDPKRVKHEQWQEVQQQAGHDLVILEDESQTTGSSDQVGGGESSGNSDTTSTNSTTGSSATNTSSTQQDEELLRRTIGEAHAAASLQSQGQGRSIGSSYQQNSSWTRSTSHSTGRTRRQTLVPRIVTKNVITGVQFYSSDEQVMEQASVLANLATGRAMLHVSGRGVVQIGFPLFQEPFEKTPRFAAKQAAAFHQQLSLRPEYASPVAILEQRRRLLEEVLAGLDGTVLQTLSDQRPASSAPIILDTQLTTERPPWNI